MRTKTKKNCFCDWNFAEFAIVCACMQICVCMKYLQCLYVCNFWLIKFLSLSLLLLFVPIFCYYYECLLLLYLAAAFGTLLLLFSSFLKLYFVSANKLFVYLQNWVNLWDFCEGVLFIIAKIFMWFNKLQWVFRKWHFSICNFAVIYSEKFLWQILYALEQIFIGSLFSLKCKKNY